MRRMGGEREAAALAATSVLRFSFRIHRLYKAV